MVIEAERATVIIGMKMTAPFIYIQSSAFIYFPSEKQGRLAIKKMMSPADILSRKLYTPKTKAPDSPLLPITSDIKLIPVERIIDWDTPIKTLSRQIIYLFYSDKKQSIVSENISRIVPIINVLARPNFVQRKVSLRLIKLEEKYIIRGTKATEKGTVVSFALSLDIFNTLIRQKGRKVPKILLFSLTHIQQIPNRQNFGLTSQYPMETSVFFYQFTTKSWIVFPLSSIVDSVMFFLIFLSDQTGFSSERLDIDGFFRPSLNCFFFYSHILDSSCYLIFHKKKRLVNVPITITISAIILYQYSLSFIKKNMINPKVKTMKLARKEKLFLQLLSLSYIDLLIPFVFVSMLGKVLDSYD